MRSTTMTIPVASARSGQVTLMDSNEDIVDRKVVDHTGEEVGKVDDLFVDLNERRVRFISVKSGDVFGVGGKTVLVPVDAIESAGTDQIVVSESKDRILNGPLADEATLASMADATGQPADTFAARPLIDAYEYYAIDEPFWSPTYRRRNWA